MGIVRLVLLGSTRVLRLLPLAVAVLAVGAGLAIPRYDSKTRIGLVLGGSLGATIWGLAGFISRISRDALGFPFAVSDRQLVLLVSVAYIPYVILAMLLLLLPHALGSIALSLLPERMKASARTKEAERVWTALLRMFGLFAVLLVLSVAGQYILATT